jgi:uncharacterized protein YceK
MPRRALAVLLSSCLILSGCGTCADLMGGCIGPKGPFFYRGVRGDIESGYWIDVPFSAVADTTLIPCGCFLYACSYFVPPASHQEELKTVPEAKESEHTVVGNNQ